MVEGLQVVDGDHDRPGGAHGDATTDVVYGIEANGPPGKPCRLAGDPPDPAATIARGGDHLELVAEVRMCLPQGLLQEQDGSDVAGAVPGECLQRPDRVLLGTADVAWNKEEQVDGDALRGGHGTIMLPVPPGRR